MPVKKAVIYTRVSTNIQESEGVSLDMQKSKAEAYCLLNDLIIKNIFSDVASGKTASTRPGLQQALKACEHEDTLFVYSLSRLSRSVMDTISIANDFEQRGINLVSFCEKIDTSTPSGRLVLTVLSAMNQWEREQLAQRTRDALQSKRARGERTGSIPYGYRLAQDGIRLVRDDSEQFMISMIQGWKEQRWSLRKIANQLTLEGYAPKRGKRWYAQTVKNILDFQPAEIFAVMPAPTQQQLMLLQ